jgi:dienelactone hydrolase
MTALRPTSRRSRVAIGIVTAVVLVTGACSGESDTSSSGDGGEPAATTAPPAEVVVDYSEPGPYPVGQITLPAGDTTAFVYYPADDESLDEGTPLASYSSAEAFPPEFQAAVPDFFVQEVPVDLVVDAPAATDGPFPLVLHSHGFAGYPLYSSQHYAHLASWGFVVAAPDHTSRNLASVVTGAEPVDGADVAQLSATRDAVVAEADVEDSPLADAVDASRLAAEGHSAGGRAVTQLAMEPDSDLDTIIGLAPAPPVRLDDLTEGDESDRATRTAEALAEQEPPELPTLIMAGENDGVIPLPPIQAFFEWLRASKQLVVIAGSGHNFPLDICKPIQERGGLVANAGDLAEAFGPVLSLGEDGCLPTDLEITQAYALRDHTTVAWLRWVFGDDDTPASLSADALEELFPEATGTVESDL